jgi:hypothetical protein
MSGGGPPSVIPLSSCDISALGLLEPTGRPPSCSPWPLHYGYYLSFGAWKSSHITSGQAVNVTSGFLISEARRRGPSTKKHIASELAEWYQLLQPALSYIDRQGTRPRANRPHPAAPYQVFPHFSLSAFWSLTCISSSHRPAASSNDTTCRAMSRARYRVRPAASPVSE